MTDYRIFETQTFLRDLAAFPEGRRRRFEEKLRAFVYPALRQQPHFGPQIRRLRGADPIMWRYRVGDYRFFYAIDDAPDVVAMIAIEHRREAYR